MTLHISLLTRDEIVVVMDSLGTRTDERGHFQKYWAPSGGRFILAGTGTMEVGESFGCVLPHPTRPNQSHRSWRRPARCSQLAGSSSPNNTDLMP